MKRPTLTDLEAANLDVLIVGGGIVGCGIARDAAQRGLKVGLVERDDFGAGTTSRSTRLIHGGLRYLELLDFGLVRSDMREREILLRIAPHLVRPLPFLVPMYGWPAWKRDRLRVGMVLYDFLSYDKSLPWHRFLSREETLRAEPNLNPRGLQGAARYFDAQVEFPERLALANVLDAAEHGALLRNHTSAERFVQDDGRIVGVEVCDGPSGRRAIVRARLTINATGPWLDRSLSQVEDGPGPLLRTTKGVHLVMPRFSNNAILLLAQSDNRAFFVVPWFGSSMVGTTDTDFHDDPADVRADVPDVTYLLGETASTFPMAANAPVYYGMAGVRALVRKDGVAEGRVSRKHAIRDHARDGGPAGLVSVLGGKITAYRGIAEETTDLAMRRLGRWTRSRTAAGPLPGGEAGPDDVFGQIWPRAQGLGIVERSARHLVGLYGTQSEELLRLTEYDRSLAGQVCPHGPTIKAQLVHAGQSEGSATLDDVLLRRAPIGLARCLALDCLDVAVGAVGATLGWDDARRGAEIEAYRRLVAHRYQAPIARESLKVPA